MSDEDRETVANAYLPAELARLVEIGVLRVVREAGSTLAGCLLEIELVGGVRIRCGAPGEFPPGMRYRIELFHDDDDNEGCPGWGVNYCTDEVPGVLEYLADAWGWTPAVIESRAAAHRERMAFADFVDGLLNGGPES